MKTRIAVQRVQAWSVFGMKPMHRALLRRTAEQIVNSLEDTAQSRFELLWELVEFSDPASHSLCDSLRRAGVLVMDSNELLSRIEKRQWSDSDIGLLYQRSNVQIRLLWNWSDRGENDLMWCTELSFDGVVSDLASMTRWLRICLERGNVTQGQPNGLLRELQLPYLAPIPTSLV